MTSASVLYPAKIYVEQTGKTPVCCSDTGGWYAHAIPEKDHETA